MRAIRSMQVRCITSEADFFDLLPEWTALWCRTPAATPFQLPAWLMAWWRCFGNAALRLLVARDAGALAGVLPLYALNEGNCRKLLPIGIGLSDYIDALADPEFPEIAGELLGAVADIPGWQECHLPDLPPGSALLHAAAPGLPESRGPTIACPVLKLPRDVAALGEAVPRKTLRDVRQVASRAEARIENAGSEGIDELFRLHEARWRSRGESGVCADPEVRAFHRTAARALDRIGALRLYRLRFGERVAAVYYGFCWRRRAYAYLGGFDPDLPRLSPGAQLLSHAVTQAVAEGCSEFHFLRGGEAYKYAWGARDRWSEARTFRR